MVNDKLIAPYRANRVEEYVSTEFGMLSYAFRLSNSHRCGCHVRESLTREIHLPLRIGCIRDSIDKRELISSYLVLMDEPDVGCKMMQTHH
jgi:hypothetical protein